MTDKTALLLTLQFAKGDERAGEGDSADEGAEEEEGLDDVGGGVGGEVGLFQEVGAETGDHRGRPHQAVEQRHHLGQVGHLEALGHHRAEGATWSRTQSYAL